MRTAFFNELFEMAATNRDLCLVVGDLGFSLVEKFAEAYPDQYVNAGVAEQNMTGLAAGMALVGKTVFTYSIANFATLRCLEQIRLDVCYHQANVKVVTVGGGLAYGSLGASHHATEDLAILRALPGMVVIAPGDPVEAKLATRAVTERSGPCYLRLGKAGEQVVHQSIPEFAIGRAIVMREGLDLTLISTGGMLPVAQAATTELTRRGIDVRLLSMHTIKPLDVEAVIAAATQTRYVVTLEEHSVIGGLGGAVAETMAELESHAPLRRIGLPSAFCDQVGDQNHLRHRYGLDLAGVLESVGDFTWREFGQGR